MPAHPETSAIWRKILASPTLRNARADFVHARDLAKELFDSPVLELKFKNGTSVATRVAEACANRLPTVDPNVFDPCWIHGDDGNDFVYCFVCEKAFAGKHMNRLMDRHPTTDRHLRAIAKILCVEPACLRNMLDCPVKGCIWTASGERMDTMQLHYKKMHLGYPPNHKLTSEEKMELYKLFNEAENPPTDKVTEEMDSSPMELDEPDHEDDRLDQYSPDSWTSGATAMDVRGRTVAPGRYANSMSGSRASSVMSMTPSESISSCSSSSSAITAMDVDCSDEDELPAISRHAAAMKVRGRCRSRDRPAVDEGNNRGRSRTRTPLQPSIPGSEAEYRRKRVDRSATHAHPSRRDHSAFPTHFHPSQLIAPRPSAQLQVSDGDSSDGL